MHSKIYDKVYKILKDKIELLKIPRLEKDAELYKTEDEVFDRQTLLTLYRLFSNNILDRVEFPISTGKEANVFKAYSPDDVPYAVKIYRTSTATFRTFTKYIYGDPRFMNIKGGHRNLVWAWAQKEFKNLQRMDAAGVRVPRPIHCHHNVLVMEYIGDEVAAAPMLKDVKLRAPKKRFRELLKALTNMYQKAKLVHGDLSEYNVLVHPPELVIIDTAQAVLLEHPMAEELLERDVKNLISYFRRYGVTLEPEAALQKIKGES